MAKRYCIYHLKSEGCTKEIEQQVSDIHGVHKINIDRSSNQLIIDADASLYNEIMIKVIETCKKIDSGCVIEYTFE
ncbi:hypothetical protein lbkm_1516 [Lachnospiraceae bacterium KM106-2]|nr:hypothetical protein lbkm_1516 [Lachnospiraceae bacterium KM106-2]